jgi:hypothetical protein
MSNPKPSFAGLHWQRTLRTPSSERFLGLEQLRDQPMREVAAVDLHYLPSGAVAGTVVLLDHRKWSEEEITSLLAALDDEFLPDVDLEQGNLTFTVVLGRVVGNFQAEPPADQAG